MHMALAAVVNTTAKTVQNVAILCMNSRQNYVLLLKIKRRFITGVVLGNKSPDLLSEHVDAYMRDKTR